MSLREIKALTHELRLLGIHNSVERRIEASRNEGCSAADLLLSVLEDEKQHRKNVAAKILESKARFRRESLLENWDSSFERGITKTKLRELAELGFWRLKKNLIIVGSTGSGKTQLSIALGRAACQMELSVLFVSVQQLLEEAAAERAAGRIQKWARKMKKYDVMILDDFALRPYTHEEAVLLVDIIEDRYRKRVHIISSQVDIGGWKTLFEDPVVADALVDRLKNPSETVILKGTSYRERLT
jgi:DNA replication protein DnaC